MLRPLSSFVVTRDSYDGRHSGDEGGHAARASFASFPAVAESSGRAEWIAAGARLAPPAHGTPRQ